MNNHNSFNNFSNLKTSIETNLSNSQITFSFNVNNNNINDNSNNNINNNNNINVINIKNFQKENKEEEKELLKNTKEKIIKEGLILSLKKRFRL